MRARGSEDKSYGGEGTRAKGTEWERAQVMLGADRQASRGQTGGKDSMCLREKMVRARMSARGHTPLATLLPSAHHPRSGGSHALHTLSRIPYRVFRSSMDRLSRLNTGPPPNPPSSLSPLRTTDQ